jgi:two-component system, OmpR family, response regulator
VVDLELGVACIDGRPLDLSTHEVAVLGVLAGAGGRVVSRNELQRRAGLSQCAPRRCDALIVGLRRALGPATILTVRGRGWRCSGGVACSRASTPVPA